MSEKKLLAISFCYLVLDIFAFSLVLPWLPTLFEFFEEKPDGLHRFTKTIIRRVSSVLSIENPASWDNVVMGGLVTSAFSLCHCLSSTVAGALSDLYSRRPLLISLQIFSIIAYVSTAWFGTSFVCFVCSRLLCGATRANVAVLTALVSDYSPAISRSRAMAVIGAAYSIGFTLGPLISALTISRLVDRSERDRLLGYLGYSAALLNTMGLFFLCGRLTQADVRKVQKRSTGISQQCVLQILNVHKLFSFNNLTMTKAGDACLRRLSLIYFLYLLLFSGLEFTLLFLTRSRFGYTSQDQGRMFSFLGIVMILVQAGLIRRFQIDQMYLGTVSIFSLSVASVILGGAWNKWLFYTGLLLFAFASAAFVPSVHATISLLAKPHRQGHVLGLVRSLNALARSVGPVSVSFTFWSIGSLQCFVLCGCILCVLCFFHFRTRIPLRSISRL